MGRKIFVSYKYADSLVAPINDGTVESITRQIFGNPTTARHYVDKIIAKMDDDGVHIYKGEEDGNDLSTFKEGTIRTQLKKKIKDSSVTVVLISKGMKTAGNESDQWIPWEVSYSLKEISSADGISKSNGLLAVVLPDENGSYAYYFDECDHCSVRNHKTSELFQVLRNNMFNVKVPSKYDASCFQQHGSVHSGNTHSYAHQVKWHEFISNIDYYVDHAVNLRDNIGNYNIQKLAFVS